MNNSIRTNPVIINTRDKIDTADNHEGRNLVAFSMLSKGQRINPNIQYLITTRKHR